MTPQDHLAAHVIRQTAAASLEVDVARGVHSDYRETVEQMVGAGQDLGRALEQRGEGLVRDVDLAFLKVAEKKENLSEKEVFFKVIERKKDLEKKDVFLKKSEERKDSGEKEAFLKTMESKILLGVFEKKENPTEKEIFHKMIKKKEHLEKSEINEIALVFNLEDEGFGEGEGYFY